MQLAVVNEGVELTSWVRLVVRNQVISQRAEGHEAPISREKGRGKGEIVPQGLSAARADTHPLGPVRLAVADESIVLNARVVRHQVRSTGLKKRSDHRRRGPAARRKHCNRQVSCPGRC